MVVVVMVLVPVAIAYMGGCSCVEVGGLLCFVSRGFSGTSWVVG